MRQIKLNKKGITNEFLIGIIILLVILAIILWSIYNTNINKYLKWIPVIGPALPDDDINVGDNTLPEGCSNIVAKVDGNYIYFESEKTNLKIVSTDAGLEIRFVETSPDELFGVIDKTSNKITILDYFLNEQSSQFQQYKNNLPSIEQIKSLNGGYYGSGRICNVYSGDLTGLMEYYKTNTISNFENKKVSCLCEDNCGNYAEWITKYSGEKGIDPLLVLAIILQESKCNASAFSGSSVGLMQINIGVHCESYEELSNNLGTCKQELINNPELNIQIGTDILKNYHKGKGVKFDGCTQAYKGKVYTGWNEALRRYNGGGCALSDGEVKYCQDNPTAKKTTSGNSCSLISQDYYVDNVITIFEKLQRGVPT